MAHEDPAGGTGTGAGPGAGDYVPAGVGLAELARAVQDCRGCELWRPASQAVFGEGPSDARLVLVGEQPGDVEDRRGRPFVGPAGRLLDRALDQLGVDRARHTYVTNAVKHFRFSQADPRKRRIHATPEAAHVAACKPWLEAELNRVRPRMVVLLGATAAKALLGPQVRVTRDRGQLRDGPPGSAARLLVTVHPSAILRTPDDERDAAFDAFLADLRTAVEAIRSAA